MNITNTAVIVGTGLLGSSFGLAAKSAGLFQRVIGVSSAAVVAKALEIGAVDDALPLEEALPQADLVLLARPVRKILEALENIGGRMKPGALVTDVGSTKEAICAAGARFVTGAKFVGGHPMAGKESRGPEAASADLFRGRPWVLTEAEPRLMAIVEALGARPVILEPAEHDRLVALSSHLPQLLSTGLASFLAPQDLRAVAGPGITDMTRLALSSYDLWEDILATNAGNVDAALDGLIAHLTAMRKDLRKAFEEGERTARSLRA